MKNKVHKELKDYEDILHLPHYVSSHRAQMPITDRAAQFAPFAAVVGHNIAVKEAARYTNQKKELDEMEKVVIDDKLREIDAQFPNLIQIEIVYFEPDVLKTGGQYITKVGNVKKLDCYNREILMEDGMRIAVDEIYTLLLLI